jgi:hypothetical protein
MGSLRIDHPEGLLSLEALETMASLYPMSERCSVSIACRWLGDLASPRTNDDKGTTPVDPPGS